MADLIDRKAAINAVNTALFPKINTAKDAEKALRALPSVDVQPVRHGHWMLCENQNQDDVNNGNYLYVCSNCNHSDIHARTVDVPYCWHCGARMDEVT